MLSFHFYLSWGFFFPLLMSSLTHWLFKSVLFNFHIFVNFPDFRLSLFASFIPSWLEQIPTMTSVLNFVSLVLWPLIWYIWECSMYTWEGCLFSWCWMKCSVYVSDSFGLKYGSSPVFPSWFSVWMIYSLLNEGYWTLLLLVYFSYFSL